MKTIATVLIFCCAAFGQHTRVSSICSDAGPIDLVACYGADPTGTNDSTTALNNAFAATTNQTRYLPAGTYKILGTLTIDTRYKVTGATGWGQTTILAGSGFSGSTCAGGSVCMAKILSSAAQTSVITGGMDGLFFDCQARAPVGAVYGGGGTFTVYGYQTQNTVFHNCTTAGAQIGANSWLLNWINVGFQGNGGDGLQVLDQTNMGENLNCHGCTFSNNTGNGLTMGPATIVQHDFHCYSCSFDTNGGWAIQNQTATTGDSLVHLDGSYIFAHQKWIQNFGRMTITGAFFGDGSSSGTLGYLIDNEAQLQTFGGRWTNSGGGAFFNPAQTGTSNCIAMIGFPTANCNSYMDGSSGNALFSGTSVSTLKVGTSGSTLSDSRELVQSAHSCGGTTTCANTANGSYKVAFGSVALSGGTATISSITGFSTINICLATDQSATNAARCFVNSSSSIAVNGTGTDTVMYVLIGN